MLCKTPLNTHRLQSPRLVQEHQILNGLLPSRERNLLHLISTPTNALVGVLINPLTPNDLYISRNAPLTSKRCILYIYSTNVGTEYFKHALYSPSFSLQNAGCFIMLTSLVPVLFTFYIQGVLKLKKNNSGAKGLTLQWKFTTGCSSVMEIRPPKFSKTLFHLLHATSFKKQ